MLVHDFLKFHAREQPDTPCIILDERELSYAQLQARSAQLANAMIESGLRQGDRFAFILKNSIESVIAYMAGSIAGLVPVPINWRLASGEWEYILNDAGVSLLIAEADYYDGLEGIRAKLTHIRVYVSVGMQTPRGWRGFDEFCEGRSIVCPKVPVSERDIYYQMYTSGTTGRPKGALLTHYAVIANAMLTMPYFRAVMGPGKRTLVVMPMFHVGAASFVIGNIVSGSTMVIHREFSPHHVADALSNREIAVVNLVPSMIQAMLAQVDDISRRDFSSLEVIIYGASSISEETLRRAMDIFDCSFFQGFGQTESSAVITFLTAEDHRRALDGKPELLLSAGRAVLGTTVRIVDEEGHERPSGEPGEIIMRGPQMMEAYWNQPEASAAALKNGWLHSGDIGVIDQEGYLFIRGRIKDMIVSGGENVYPVEVENVLIEHPAIADVAVIGLPDKKFGEAVTAVVILGPGAFLEADEMIDFCRGKLGGFKIPRQIRVVKEFPRNASGKVLKKELRDTYRVSS